MEAISCRTATESLRPVLIYSFAFGMAFRPLVMIAAADVVVAAAAPFLALDSHSATAAVAAEILNHFFFIFFNFQF